LDSTASDITTYTYDNRNRLTSVSYQAAFGGAYSYVVDYTYDAFDRLVAADQTVGGGSTPLVEAYFYDWQNNMALVLDGGGNVVERDLYGPGGQILASESPLPSGEGQGEGSVVSWFLTDNEGSVRDVAVLSGSTTTITDHLVYDAFGNITSQTAGAATPRFTYAGMMLDAVTGLYYDGARWYDAAMGSFISQDPLGFAAGDTNLYRYCGNDPTSETDPTGLASSGQGPCGPSCQCGCQSGQPICLTTCYDGEDIDGDGPSEGDGVCHAVYANAARAPAGGDALAQAMLANPGALVLDDRGGSPYSPPLDVSSGMTLQTGAPDRSRSPVLAGAAAFLDTVFVQEIYGGTRALVTFEAGTAVGNRAVAIVEMDNGTAFSGGVGEWAHAMRAVFGDISQMNQLAEGGVGFDIANGQQLGGVERVRRCVSGVTGASGALAGGLSLASRLSAAAAGAAYEDAVAQAQQQFPNLAGKIEQHHITPQYLGGAANGPTVRLNAAYHQCITNAFRNQWKYGTGTMPNPEELQGIMQRVYGTYPLPASPTP
jgi:RHS repeat-associated protein